MHHVISTDHASFSAAAQGTWWTLEYDSAVLPTEVATGYITHQVITDRVIINHVIFFAVTQGTWPTQAACRSLWAVLQQWQRLELSWSTLTPPRGTHLPF